MAENEEDYEGEEDEEMSETKPASVQAEDEDSYCSAPSYNSQDGALPLPVASLAPKYPKKRLLRPRHYRQGDSQLQGTQYTTVTGSTIVAGRPVTSQLGESNQTTQYVANPGNGEDS